MLRNWLVTADDRTGALETAAELAASVGPVTVFVGGVVTMGGVVDLGTRAMSRVNAVAAVEAVPVARWNAHKIDSTLRGNWAAELRTRRMALDRRALVLPAWPEMGRTCRGGVVHVHGAPVAAVHDRLPEAELLADVDAFRRWLAGDGEVAALDIADTDEMLAAAHLVASGEVLIAGPAGPIGACFAARFGRRPAIVRPDLAEPVLVVCGSATDVSREQLRRLAAVRPDIEVLAAPMAVGDLRPDVARSLAAAAAGRSAGTLLVIGGDTAAAVLGDAPRLVGGTVAPGMPWSHGEHGQGPLVITKAGGFGDPDALVRLFSRETG